MGIDLWVLVMVCVGKFGCCESATKDGVILETDPMPEGLKEVRLTNDHWWYNVGGTDVDVGSTSNVVTLKAVSGAKKKMLCVGIIISRKHVLTAAQCVNPENRMDPDKYGPSMTPFIVKIRTMSNFTDKEGVIVYSSKVCLDPEFEELPDGSWTGRMVAVLTLDVPIRHIAADPHGFHPPYGPCTPLRYPCWPLTWRKDIYLNSRPWYPATTKTYIVTNCSSVISSKLLDDHRYACAMDFIPGTPFTMRLMYTGSALVCRQRIVAIATPIVSSHPRYRLFERVDNDVDWVKKCTMGSGQSDHRISVIFLFIVISCHLCN